MIRLGTIRRGLLLGQWRVVSALVLICIALGLPELKLPRTTFDYIVTFDITQSMNVEDVSLDGMTVRRIALARAGVRDLMRRVPCGSKLGFSIFSGYRSFMLLMPVEVCGNYDVLLSALDNINDRMRWANASSISKGVYWAVRNAQGFTDTRVAFITDGQEAPPLQVSEIIPADNAEGSVQGWVIGVGGDAPTRIPKTDPDGAVIGYWKSDEVTQDPNAADGVSQEQLSQLREHYLMTLADLNHLSYKRLEKPAQLANTLLDRKLGHRTPAMRNVRWIAALLALLLLSWHYIARGAPPADAN